MIYEGIFKEVKEILSKLGKKKKRRKKKKPKKRPAKERLFRDCEGLPRLLRKGIKEGKRWFRL
jgi:hypothetical protein